MREGRETEVTVQVFNSPEDVDRILKQQGFEVTEEVEFNDDYFTKETNILDLSFQELISGSILIREIVGDKKKNVLLFKKKFFDENGVVVSEEKVKTEVADKDVAVQIFELAGLNHYCRLENHSLIYSRHDMGFALQKVNGLGNFIEIEEDDSMENLSEQQKIEKLVSNLKGLGLHLGNDYSCKKVYMMLHKEDSHA